MVPDAEVWRVARRLCRTPTRPGSATNFGHREAPTDLAGEHVRDLGMSRHRLNRSGGGVDPQRMRPPLSFQMTAMSSQVAKQVAPLHPTTTFSRAALAGTPRKPSLRLSSRI